MSGGSQHNPNGRQPQLGSSWNPIQLQVANLLARAPQAHMSSERGVTWHTPTPPPIYPPDPLQAMKTAAGNAMFRHTGTPPELFRHTPTPPDKHLMSRHTPSPGDMKAAAVVPPPDLYSHLGPGRDKLRTEELAAFARAHGGGGVDLSVGSHRSNGAPSLSIRDTSTINNLLARVPPRPLSLPHARVDSLLERLAPASVIVHSRPLPDPDSNEDSVDSTGMPTNKRKRKPEKTIKLSPITIPIIPFENGEHDKQERNGKELMPEQPKMEPQEPPLEIPRPARPSSAETIDDIAAMVAQKDTETIAPVPMETSSVIEHQQTVTVDNLKSVLSSPEPKPKDPIEPPPILTPTPLKQDVEPQKSPMKTEEIRPESPKVEVAAAPKRRSTRNSNNEATNAPVESPSEAKQAEAEPNTGEPTSACFVEVENQLEMMFAGIDEDPKKEDETQKDIDKCEATKPKRRKSAAPKPEGKASRRSSRGSDSSPRCKPARKAAQSGGQNKGKRKNKNQKNIQKTATVKDQGVKDAYDSGSNASHSSRSRGPYIQIRGPRDSPLSVSVINAPTGEDDGDQTTNRRKDEYRNGLRTRGLHASTLGLRYDAITPDATWLCAFCEKGPHANGLGDLFGPYTVDTDCEEYRALDEITRRSYESPTNEVWFHGACAVWAPGLIAAGARLWGLASAVWGSRGSKCNGCNKPGAPIACSTRHCRARTHLPCAANWKLLEEEFKATCPRHA